MWSVRNELPHETSVSFTQPRLSYLLHKMPNIFAQTYFSSLSLSLSTLIDMCPVFGLGDNVSCLCTHNVKRKLSWTISFVSTLYLACVTTMAIFTQPFTLVSLTFDSLSIVCSLSHPLPLIILLIYFWYYFSHTLFFGGFFPFAVDHHHHWASFI